MVPGWLPGGWWQQRDRSAKLIHSTLQLFTCCPHPVCPDVDSCSIEAALAGGLPVMVDRARQEGQEQQQQPTAAGGSNSKQ